MRIRSLVVPIVLLALTLPVSARAREGVNPGTHPAQLLDGLPLSFEANYGQAGESVRFLVRGSGYTLWLTEQDVWLGLQQPGARNGALIRSRLVGASSHIRAEGAEPLPGKSNYFHGDDPARWITGIPTYRTVRYKQVYRGIDLLYYGTQGRLEYDFVVAPGANPQVIRLAFEGIRKMELDADGDLLLAAGSQQVRWRRPVAYQLSNGERRPVTVAFEKRGKSQVGFRVSGYDPSLPLVIDPTLSYSTYYGGIYNETPRGIAVDSTGNVYVAGHTTSANLPMAATGYQRNFGGLGDQFVTGDAFVAKLNPTGTALVYSTFLGGSRSDLGLALAVDSQGNAYVTGWTDSTNFPNTPGAFQQAYQGRNAVTMNHTGDAFATKLDPTGGALVYSTYLGGSGDDVGIAIAVDSSGNAYVGGATMSTNFPVTNGAYQATFSGQGGMPEHPQAHLVPLMTGDGFVAKLNSAGSALSFCTYLGGNLDDGVSSIALDSSEDIYVAGGTLSTNFPTTTGALQTTFAGYGTPGQGIFRFGDGFVSKLRYDGQALLASTYLGGSRDDSITSLALGPTGDVYVAGFTSSTNFPTTVGAYQTAFRGSTSGTVNELIWGDAFVARLNPALSTRVYSTYLGGSLDEVAWGITVDSAGSAFVVGETQSRDFPLSTDALQSVFGGEEGEPGIQMWGDGFLAQLPAVGNSLIYATYLGGNAGDGASSIVLDGAGNAYIAGRSYSTNFPTTQGAMQRAMAGGNYNWGYPPGDAFVMKISGFQAPSALATVSAASFAPSVPLAPEVIAAAFGQGLAAEIATAPAGATLPTSLLGLTLTVTDSEGTGRVAPLWLVSPGQINFLVPAGTALGAATLTLADDTHTVATGSLQIDAVAPGIFTANVSGSGVPAAQALRVRDGNVSNVDVYVPGCTPGSCAPAPIDLGPETDQVFLVLYVTGVRGRSSLTAVTATIGGEDARVDYAGPVAGLFGLDQVNLLVPRSLVGRGQVDVVLTVDNKVANTVTINIQ